MYKEKPIIGVYANFTTDDSIGINLNLGVAEQHWQLLPDDYIEAIERAGGIPFIIPVNENIENAIQLLQVVDGLLLTGGPDINPQIYGENPQFGIKEIDMKRDEHEFALTKYVLNETSLPILGICRGLQLLTVVSGGSLYQDIRLHRPNSFNHTVLHVEKHYPTHTVTIEKDSLFYRIFKKEEIGVNSFHHQAVKRVGKRFKVTMISDDGVVEGIEMEGDRFICAVQWHPESMLDYRDEYLKLFEYFIKCCRR